MPLKKWHFSCDPRRIRTFDLRIRSALLYPAELWNQFNKLNYGFEFRQQSEEPMTNLSGWQDSNLRPPAPKAGAITELRYTPNASANIVFILNIRVCFFKIIFLLAHFWVRDGSGILFLP